MLSEVESCLCIMPCYIESSLVNDLKRRKGRISEVTVCSKYLTRLNDYQVDAFILFLSYIADQESNTRTLREPI